MLLPIPAHDVIPSYDFWPPPMISDACQVAPMIPDAFRRWPEPRFKIFPISFRLPLSTNQKAARTMVTQVPPNAADIHLYMYLKIRYIIV